MCDVIVVGAGIAGLAAAESLVAAGRSVVVLEKSRGVGGRMATRRVKTAIGEFALDHGAQYFTSRSDAFRARLAPLQATGVVTPWIEAVATLLSDGTLVWPGPEHTYPRYACPAGMTAVCKSLAVDLDIRLEHRAVAVDADGALWRVHSETPTGMQTVEGRALLVTPPPEQSFALLGNWGEQDALAPARAVAFDPCLAVMVGYEAGALDLPDGLRWEDDPRIAWTAVDGSKRPIPAATLVIHSQPDFARDAAEQPREEAGRTLLAHCAQRLAKHSTVDLAQPAWMQVHYWRYAMPTNPLAELCLTVRSPLPLAMAGCWCAGARVEGAFLSGRAAAEALLPWLA